MSIDKRLQDKICDRAERSKKHEENVIEVKWCVDCTELVMPDSVHRHERHWLDEWFICDVCGKDYETYNSAFNCCAAEDIKI